MPALAFSESPSYVSLVRWRLDQNLDGERDFMSGCIIELRPQRVVDSRSNCGGHGSHQ